MKDEPIYSVCSMGKDRFFWAVWLSYNALCEGKPASAGYTSSRAEAEQAAIAVAGPGGRTWGDKFARGYRSRMACEKRLQRKSASADTAPIEYVYSSEYNIPDGPERSYWIIRRYRIHKKTRKKIFVEDEYDTWWSQQEDGTWRESNRGWNRRALKGTWEDYDVRTFTLDRAEFEAKGCTRAGWNAGFSVRGGDFYPTFETVRQLIEERGRNRYRVDQSIETPSCLILLGLNLPCTIEDIKRAYRQRVKAAHPDHGGDEAAFIELHSAYEQALRLAA